MDNFEMARASVKQALERVETARRALDEGHYAYAVRQSQEAVAEGCSTARGGRAS
ncbi:MAG: HEPN domain-containing protein [Candidatus Caldarchaeum sp.]|nr:HEPN domain-containing protein [Candidatus Caldarchaeum sp.]